MKLLIDIPYEAYYTFKCDLGKGNLNALAEIVANGKPYEPIGDLISRGDALKAVDKRHEELLHDTEYLKKHCQIDLLGIKKHILEIPPVDAIVNEIEVRPQGECCGSCYLCDVGDCGADMRGGRKCDCISREALKDIAYINKGNFNTVEGIREWIDNAQAIPLPNGKITWEQGYGCGYHQAKEDIARRIKEQYNEHHELIPYWLSIGDVKGGAE